MFCLGSFISKHVLMWMTDERSTKQKRMDDCMRNSESGNGKNFQETLDFFLIVMKVPIFLMSGYPKSLKNLLIFLSIFRIMVVFQ